MRRHPDHLSRPSTVAARAGTCGYCGVYLRAGVAIALLPEPMHLPGLFYDVERRCFRAPGEATPGRTRSHRRKWAHARCIESRSDDELADTAAERADRIKRQRAAAPPRKRARPDPIPTLSR